MGSSIKILGIDPGTKVLGYGIIEKRGGNSLKLIEAGAVKFKSVELQDSIRDISVEFNSIFEKHNIDRVAMESLFFSKNPQSVLKLAQFRGGLLHYFLGEFDKVFEYSPLEVKRATTGSGKSTKEQVNFMVRKLLSVKSEIKPLDISDALAVAITDSQRVGF
jgi:crossover junction endodeoxyribonuclease RuvC